MDGLERSNGPKNNLPSLPKLMITSPTSENNDSSECDNLQQVKRGFYDTTKPAKAVNHALSPYRYTNNLN